MVIFHVSDPYNRMDLIFGLVLSARFFFFHVLIGMLKTVLAFPILAFTSSYIPLSTVIMLCLPPVVDYK